MDTVHNVWLDKLYEENGSYHFRPDAGNWSQLYFTSMGVQAPNMDLPPYYCEMLWDTNGNRIDSVYQKCIDCADMLESITPEDNLAFYLLCGTIDKYIAYPTYLAFESALDNKGLEYKKIYQEYDHGIWYPDLHIPMFRWMDSLIADAYVHLDVEEIKQSLGRDLLVYPNPTRGKVTISWQLAVGSRQYGDVEIEILDGRGMVIHSIRQENSKPICYDLSSYPAGMYSVRLQAGSEVRVRKVIKN
jgi:hypothetical protein